MGDLLGLFGTPDTEAVRVAAASMLARLAPLWPLPVFMLVKGGRARLVENMDVWRGYLESGPQRLMFRNAGIDKSRARLVEWGIVDDEPAAPLFMPLSEAMERGIEVPHWKDTSRGLYLCDEEWSEVSAMRPLVGADGLLPWLLFRWALAATSWSEIDDGPEASVAMLRSDAERIFQAQSLAAAPCVVVPLRVADDHEASQAELRRQIEALQPMQLPGKGKKSEPEKRRQLREQMLSEYELRMRLDGARAEVAHEKMAALWGLGLNTVRSYLTTARKAQPSAGELASKRPVSSG